MPGPRWLSRLVRLALSKLALKMKGMPRASARSRRLEAMKWLCSRLSMTQGPAMRKKLWSVKGRAKSMATSAPSLDGSLVPRGD